MKVDGVVESVLYVDDLDVAKAFYSRIPGVEFFSEVQGRHVFFTTGGQMVLLFNPEATQKPGDLPPHGTQGDGHLALAVEEEDIPKWKFWLETESIDVECEYTWPNGRRSLYFRDPAGNSLEFTSYEMWGLG